MISFRLDLPYVYLETFKISINLRVEHSFSIINLLVSLLHTSLKKNIDQLMGICLNGPKCLSEEQLEKIIDLNKDNAPRIISVMFFDVIFY